MTDHAELDLVVPDVSHLITEDDAPVDNIFQEKQMRLLVEPLYSSWRPVNEAGAERRFVAAADVGIFGSIHERAVVPDVLLALDVEVPDEFWRKDRRSYYVWEFGKAPEVVVEIVSNREGEELEGKRAIYSKLRIAHYVVFDVLRLLGNSPLHVFELRGDLLVPASDALFPRLGVGLTEWSGTFEGKHANWLRWCEIDGEVIPTGQERAKHERERAEHERERAEHERERAERFAQKLRELGVDPE
jgi:hypothetical protein